MVGIVLFRGISSGAGTGVVLITARHLGPSGRGAFVLEYTLALFAAVVCSLGVNLAGRVHLVKPDEPIAMGEYVGLSGALTVLQVLVCLVVGVTLLPLAGVRLAGIDLAVFAALGANQLLQYLLNDALNAFGLTVQAAMTEAFGFLAQLVLVGVLALAGATQVRMFVLAVIGGTTVQLLLGVRELRRAGIGLRPLYGMESWRCLVVSGLPGIATSLAQVLTFRIDRYFVGFFLSPAAVGVYSVASTAPEFLRLVPLAVAQPVLHRLASGSARMVQFRRARAACMAATIAAAAGVFVVASPAVRILFGTPFAGAITPLRILLLAEVGMTLFFMDAVPLVSFGHISDTAVAATVGFALVAVADLVLIPPYGLVGAAWASVAAYSVMGFLAHVLLRRRLRARAAARRVSVRP